MSRAAMNQLVQQHADLVKRIAYHLAARLPPSVQVDDLVQAGMIGLMEAAQHYRPDRGASFETYAGIRVRGAMLDEVRRNDWAPRSVHRRARQVADAIHDLENEAGHEASDLDIARRLDIPLDEYHRIVQDSARCPLHSLDDEDGQGGLPQVADASATPAELLEDEDFQRALVQAIAGLPERERLAMSLYYEQELTLREIGAVMNITESRVCQIHGQAMARVRARLADWTTESPASRASP